jgi:predicted DNA-binding ribbon-helix-helix protein
VKRSLTIKGHRTSISLEPEFWDQLKKIITARNISLAELVSEIDATRGERNLSSAIRVFVLASISHDYPELFQGSLPIKS